MKPNFYFIFTPDILHDLPATWLLSFHIGEQQNTLLNQLGRDYPTVSLLNFRVIGEKIQSLLAQISWSLTVLAALGVISGILLIFTLLRLSLQQRSQEVLLYRTLGASRKYIRQTLLSEYGLMALSAGVIAALGAEIVIYSLMKWGFQLTPSLHLSLWFAVPAIAVMIVFISLSRVIRKLLRT
ncbi:FtsX-like permease family protein [Psychromonas sp. MME2]